MDICIYAYEALSGRAKASTETIPVKKGMPKLNHKQCYGFR